MAAILKKQGIFYASVPKVACTSVKEFFFEIENGFQFRMFEASGRKRHIHHFYPALLREQFPEGRIRGLHKVAVVREPVVRFLSAYSNRVRHHHELSMKSAGEALQRLGLEPNPSLGLFVDRIEEYCLAHPSIKHHTQPMVDFLGDDADFYDKVYRMSELKTFEEEMNAVAEMDVRMPHSQRGGPRVTQDALSPAQITKIESLYEKDYEVFGQYF